MKVVETTAYVSILREQEVYMRIAGNSMLPFLVHERDYIWFRKPDRELKRGDMVFYQRANGQFVMHRIWKVKEEKYYLIGDAHRNIEGPIAKEQIFALVTGVMRNGKEIRPGKFFWEFFEHVWLRMRPFRYTLLRVDRVIGRIKR